MEKEQQEEKLPKPILLKDLGYLYANENSKQKRHYGIFKCGFCGTNFKANTYDINRGHIKSCGCHRKRRSSEIHKTHGLSNSRLSRIWRDIKSRTLNSKDKDYPNYGGRGRGITVYEEWKNDFMSFYNWAMSNGYSDELSIDRIDNDGNYCPENCRWATSNIQNRNKRIRKDNKTGFKGVSFVKAKNKYATYIRINNKSKGLGHFLTPVEGAIAYNNYIIENNLEGFILNEIPEEYLRQNLKEERI